MILNAIVGAEMPLRDVGIEVVAGSGVAAARVSATLRLMAQRGAAPHGSRPELGAYKATDTWRQT